MEPKEDVFNGTRDRYKGVTVSTASERLEITKFPIKLQSNYIKTIKCFPRQTKN